MTNLFSSPFIEERLYLKSMEQPRHDYQAFSSPFIEERLYLEYIKNLLKNDLFSSPFIEERLYLRRNMNNIIEHQGFSSPFIEERLYFEGRKIVFLELDGSRPLLSRSGCILEFIDRMHDLENVLVPFYRGAVVFTRLRTHI